MTETADQRTESVPASKPGPVRKRRVTPDQTTAKLRERVGELEREIEELKACAVERLQVCESFRSDEPDPLHPPCPESHTDNANRFMNDLKPAMAAVFNVADGLVRGKWLKGMPEKILADIYPNLRRSAARAIMEGRCGEPPFEIPNWAHRRMDAVLNLMDLFETILFEYAKATDTGS